MSNENDDLMNPRHPQSPYNRYNYDSPFSVVNPNSPYYDPTKTSLMETRGPVPVGSLDGVVALILMLPVLLAIGILAVPAIWIYRRWGKEAMGWCGVIAIFGFIFNMILLCLVMGW